jgi:HD-like signal output (HDOD) protein
MGTVYTDKIKPGMVVAEEVRDVNGRLLLGKRNSIQPSHMRIFKIWGITEVKIQGEVGIKDAPVQHIEPELLEKIREKTQHIFSHVDLEHPALKEIFRLSIEYRSRNGHSEKEAPIPVNGAPGKKSDLQINFLDRFKKKKMNLPEIPKIVSELNEVISNPLSSAEDIANVVNKSPSLTATLLRIVNSALYGCPSKIDKVSQAVTLIGTKEIFGLAVGISVLAIFKKVPKEVTNMYSFLRHSIACGIIARILAAHKNLQHTEQLFVSGLLHDLGRVLVYTYFPDESVRILGNSYSSDKLLVEEEDDYLGCNHTDVVRYLMQHWKLPLALENNVFYHHRPSEAQNPLPATIVHLADIMVNALGMGSSGERFVPPLDNAAWEDLNLSTSSFEVVIKQATHQFYSLETILDE